MTDLIRIVDIDALLSGEPRLLCRRHNVLQVDLAGENNDVTPSRVPKPNALPVS